MRKTVKTPTMLLSSRGFPVDIDELLLLNFAGGLAAIQSNPRSHSQ